MNKDNVISPYNICAVYASFNYVVISRLVKDYNILTLTDLHYMSVINALYPTPFTFNYFAQNYSSLTRWNDRKLHILIDRLVNFGYLERTTTGKRIKYGYTPLFDRFRSDYIKQYEYLSNRRKHLLSGAKDKGGK